MSSLCLGQKPENMRVVDLSWAVMTPLTSQKCQLTVRFEVFGPSLSCPPPTGPAGLCFRIEHDPCCNAGKELLFHPTDGQYSYQVHTTYL